MNILLCAVFLWLFKFSGSLTDEDIKGALTWFQNNCTDDHVSYCKAVLGRNLRNSQCTIEKKDPHRVDCARHFPSVRCKDAIEVNVPDVVIFGDWFWLNCSLIEAGVLYKIEWFKDDRPIYSFTPGDPDQIQSFSIPDIEIDMNRSYQSNVYARASTLETEGDYKCSVHIEAPSFQTYEEERVVNLIVIPESDLSITGVADEYFVGDFVNVSCSSGPAKPVNELKWYINGVPAPTSLEREFFLDSGQSDLIITSLFLRFRVEEDHLSNGSISLECKGDILGQFGLKSKKIDIRVFAILMEENGGTSRFDNSILKLFLFGSLMSLWRTYIL